uniref:Uncharacterized protein n=1 Tax=Haptolina brevifila TaxID=156173 RepID=A0A7S2D2V1_9EUKA
MALIVDPLTSFARKPTMHARATNMKVHEWTPLRDVAKLVADRVQSTSMQLQQLTTSDAFRISLGVIRTCFGSVKQEPSSHPWLHAVANWVDEASPSQHEALELGTEGRIRLPSVPPSNTRVYHGSVTHTYSADSEQIERIAGHGSGSAVTKCVVSHRGKSFGACVPRQSSADLIVVGKSTQHQGEQGAWLLFGDDRGSTHVHVRDDMSVDADLVYDRLEAGAQVHCCQSKALKPLVERALSEEARCRGVDARDKLAQWEAEGKIHTDCMCKKASETEGPP